MKAIVLYSSKTGNTKLVAESIAKALPEGTPCLSVTEDLPQLSEYDCVFLGYWVDRGTADAAAQKVLKELNNKYVALFATLGADPNSPHAAKCLENGAVLLPEGKKPVDSFICQGKIDPQLLEMMYKRFPSDNVHGRNPESKARAKQASTHPDTQDLENAASFAKAVFSKVQEAEQAE